jgi:hypothetical protein
VDRRGIGVNGEGTGAEERGGDVDRIGGGKGEA